MKGEKSISLENLQNMLKGVIEGNFRDYMWIVAEIQEVKNHPSGHCYLDLVHKEGEGRITAKASGIIWASSYRIIRPYFETTTGGPISRGMKLLFRGQVQYSQVYGISIVITDVDPSFTVGEAELLRQKSISKLKEEGMMDLNGSLDLPLLPRRFAVVSSETAAGYGDFMKHLHSNGYGFVFQTMLYPSPMQGEQAPAGVIAALDLISQQTDMFDAVVIIRGGGSVNDLSCFDDYELALNIAQFPLPVITGIGHEQDYHIADMVAHTSLKTPTAVADYIVDFFIKEEMRLNFMSRRVLLSLQGRVVEEKGRCEKLSSRIISKVNMVVSDALHRVERLEQRIEMNNPFAIVDRGYPMVFGLKGRIDSCERLSEGDKIELLMRGGVAECIVKKVKKDGYGAKE